MDEVLELCRRVLGDGDKAEEAAAVAASAPTSDRIELLAAAARACRARAETENGNAAAASAEGEADRGGLSEAVARELAAATGRLPERQREALALRELLRLSYEQMSRVMEIDAAAVAPLLARSRLQLRAERRGAAREPEAGTCDAREKSLRILARRQDSEAISEDDDEWLLAHLAECSACEMAHSAMLEASVCYRAWP